MYPMIEWFSFTSDLFGTPSLYKCIGALGIRCSSPSSPLGYCHYCAIHCAIHRHCAIATVTVPSPLPLCHCHCHCAIAIATVPSLCYCHCHCAITASPLLCYSLRHSLPLLCYSLPLCHHHCHCAFAIATVLLPLPLSDCAIPHCHHAIIHGLDPTLIAITGATTPPPTQ